MNTGQKIKALRLQKGYTLEELGDKIGVGKSTVRKWENGIIANMKRDKIFKIAEALDTTPSYLIGWEECAIFPIYEKLNDIGKKKVTEYINDMLKLYPKE